jgi:predicted signal transduction protein with EAL and GGDEF domain
MFNLITVAEGVERPEQLRRLAELGCDQVQGFYLARPLPTDAVEHLLRQERATQHRTTREASPEPNAPDRSGRRATPSIAVPPG